MYRILLSIVLVICFAANTQKEPKKVYICQGSRSECYHMQKDCKGLEYCTTNLKEVTIDQAKKMGRRPCKFCCK